MRRQKKKQEEEAEANRPKVCLYRLCGRLFVRSFVCACVRACVCVCVLVGGWSVGGSVRCTAPRSSVCSTGRVTSLAARHVRACVRAWTRHQSSRWDVRACLPAGLCANLCVGSATHPALQHVAVSERCPAQAAAGFTWRRPHRLRRKGSWKERACWWFLGGAMRFTGCACVHAFVRCLCWASGPWSVLIQSHSFLRRPWPCCCCCCCCCCCRCRCRCSCHAAQCAHSRKCFASYETYRSG